MSISGSLTAAAYISYPWLRDPQFATDTPNDSITQWGPYSTLASGQLFMFDMNCKEWVSPSGNKSGPWEDATAWVNNYSYGLSWGSGMIKNSNDFQIRIQAGQADKDRRTKEDEKRR